MRYIDASSFAYTAHNYTLYREFLGSSKKDEQQQN